MLAPSCTSIPLSVVLAPPSGTTQSTPLLQIFHSSCIYWALILETCGHGEADPEWSLWWWWWKPLGTGSPEEASGLAKRGQSGGLPVGGNIYAKFWRMNKIWLGNWCGKRKNVSGRRNSIWRWENIFSVNERGSKWLELCVWGRISGLLRTGAWSSDLDGKDGTPLLLKQVWVQLCFILSNCFARKQFTPPPSRYRSAHLTTSFLVLGLSLFKSLPISARKNQYLTV